LYTVPCQQRSQARRTEQVRIDPLLRGPSDTACSYGETPLHQAIRGGNYEASEFLLKKGARIDLIGRDGSSLEQAKRVLDEETYAKIENLVREMVCLSGPSLLALTSHTKGFSPITQSIVSYDTLPPAVVDMVTASKVSPQTIDQNFELFSDVIRFLTGEKHFPAAPDCWFLLPLLIPSDPLPQWIRSPSNQRSLSMSTR
jgi:hypothetical protein